MQCAKPIIAWPARSSVVNGFVLTWVKSRRDLMEGTRGSEEAAVHSRRDLTQLVPAQDGGVAVKAQRALTLSALRAVCRPSALTAGAGLAGDTAFFRAPRLAFTGDGSFTTIGASVRGTWRRGSGAAVIGGTSGSCGD